MSLSVNLSARCVLIKDNETCPRCSNPMFPHAFYLQARSEEGAAEVGPLCTSCALGGVELVAMWKKPQGKSQVCSKLRRRAVTNQERARSEELGGKRQTGSGAKAHYKADGRVDGEYRIECKSTTAKSFVVKLGDLTKIRSECAGLEVPLFEVEFWDKGTLQPLDKWVLVPWDAWRKKARC